jgi:SAM-dependent methyltransferase
MTSTAASTATSTTTSTSTSTATSTTTSTTLGGMPRGTREQNWPPLPEPEHRPLHRAVLAALGPVRGARLLDVGCGVGLLLRSAECRGALVAGVDTAAELLEIAHWALSDADLRIGDVRALPFDDGAFDVVTACTAAPEGGADRDAVLAELVRVVRPGGRIAVGGRVHPAGCWAREFGTRLGRLIMGPLVAGPVDLDPDPGLADDLRAAGLTVQTTGEVVCPAVYPDLGAGWAAMLRGERVLLAIRMAGVHAVHDAFTASVAAGIGEDGSVRLCRGFQYAVATVPGRKAYGA